MVTEENVLFVNDNFGILKITSRNEKITYIQWVDQVEKEKSSPILEECRKQLLEYFQRKRTQFDLPYQQNGTPFQKQVWNAVKEISYGETVSYLDIAKKVKNEKGVRAVAAAIGKNPILVVIPCHRIVGKSGKLTGYAAGLERKRALLDIENDRKLF